MAAVFISYAREDKDFIYKLQGAFAARQREVWVDLEDLYVGEEFWQQICTAIEEAHAFVFVMSPDSIASPYCRREIEHAVAHNKRIIPLLYRESDEKALHPAIAARHWQSFRASDNFSLGFSSLLEAVDTDPDWIHTHTRLLVRAKDWEAHDHNNSFLLRGQDLHNAEQWLQHAEQKDPQPTVLHTQYIIASRHAATKSKRVRLSVATSVLGIVAALVVIALIQSQYARSQTKVVFARQLASQVEAMKDRPDLSSLRELLAVTASKLSPSPESDQAVLQAAVLLPCATAKVGITSIAFSPNGQFIATAGYSCVVRIWSVANQQPVSLLIHPSGITTMAFSPDSKYLATVDWDGHAHVWIITTGQELSPMAREEGIIAISFSPDGKYLATASKDKTVHVWEYNTNREILRGMHDNGSTSLAFSHDSRYLASSSWDKTVRIWDLVSGREIKRLTHKRGSLR